MHYLLFFFYYCHLFQEQVLIGARAGIKIQKEEVKFRLSQVCSLSGFPRQYDIFYGNFVWWLRKHKLPFITWPQIRIPGGCVTRIFGLRFWRLGFGFLALFGIYLLLLCDKKNDHLNDGFRRISGFIILHFIISYNIYYTRLVKLWRKLK